MVRYFVSIFVLAIVSGLAHSYGGYEESYPSPPMPPKKVEAAVMSQSKVKTVPVMSSKGGGGGGNTIVDINGSGGGGLVLRFNSSPGSNIQSIQKSGGGGGAGKVQKQSIVAEPDLLIQNVQKPVIQKVRLQITPIRKVFQEVKPVQEQVETVIAKGMEDGGDSKYPPPPPPPPPMPKYGDMY